MRKYITKKTNGFLLIEEDWKQSIIADTYTYLLVAFFAYLLYLYTSTFGRSLVFEMLFGICFFTVIFSKFKARQKIISKEEALKELDEFFA